MDGWNTTFLLGFGLFSGAKTLVSGRVKYRGIFTTYLDDKLVQIFQRMSEPSYGHAKAGPFTITNSPKKCPAFIFDAMCIGMFDQDVTTSL